jgi:hypothetical protein
MAKEPKQPEPLHDPTPQPLKDPPDKPMRDPPGDPTYEPDQPFGDPEPSPGKSDPEPPKPTAILIVASARCTEGPAERGSPAKVFDASLITDVRASKQKNPAGGTAGFSY